MDGLYERLKADIKTIGLPDDFNLVLKPYSKKYLGRYNPNTDKLWVFMYVDESLTTMYPYEEILITTVHELVHRVQYKDPNHVRIKGVMHDPQFHALFNEYKLKAQLLLFKRYYVKEEVELNREKRPSCRKPKLIRAYC